MAYLCIFIMADVTHGLKIQSGTINQTGIPMVLKTQPERYRNMAQDDLKGRITEK